MNPTGQIRIAVSASQPATRNLWAHCLRSAGYEVIEVGADAELVVGFERGAVDVVLLGWETVDQAGLELCRRLVANPLPPKIVLISPDFADSQQRAAGLDAGAAACLAEPVVPGELLAQVRSLLRFQKHQSTVRGARETADNQPGVPDREEPAKFDTESARGEPADPLSEERLRLALTASSTGVWEWDVLTNSVLWSPECYEITGSRNFGGTFESFTRLLHPDDAPRVNAAIQKALAERSDYAAEFRIVRPDGEVRWVSAFGRAEFNDAGKPVRMVGTVYDTTMRRYVLERVRQLYEELSQRNDELEAERARWQRVVEGIADEVWLCDKEGRMTLVNQPEVVNVGMKRFTDKPISEIVSEIDIFEPDGRPRPLERAPLMRSLAGEIVRGEEIMRHRATGRTVWRQFSSAPIRDSAGTILGSIAIVWDITEHKRNEELLRLTRFAVDNASDAILWLGLNARFNYVNAAACRLLGYSRQELLELTVHDIDPSQPRETWPAACERLKQEKSFTFETQLSTKSRELVPVEVTVNYLEFDGKVYHCSSIRDITLRKQAESCLLKDLERGRLLIDLYEKSNRLTDLELYNYVLERVIALTDSSIGFLHRVLPDQQAIILTTWNDSRNACALPESEQYPIQSAGRWADCIRFHRPVVCNDAGTADQNEFPAGHLSVQRFMSIPVIEGDKVRLVVGVGNKAVNYVEQDVVQIQVVASELQEILKQRTAEAVVRRSEERFRGLVDSLTDAMFVHRVGYDAVQSRFIEVNDVACRMLGYTREELLTMSPLDLDAPDSGVTMAEISDKVAAGKNVVFEQVHLSKDKRRIPVEISTRLFLLDGEPAVVSLARDITGRKNAEDTLRKLSCAVEQSSAGIIITDINGVIEYANPRCCLVTGYSLEEVIGQNPRIFKSGRTAPEDYQKLWETIMAGGDWNGELLNRKKSGDLFWERATISPIKQPGGKITHFVAVKEDVTEQKRTEEALLASKVELRALAGRLQAVREEERTRLAREIHDVLAQELSFLKMEISSLKYRLGQAGQDGFVRRLDDMNGSVNRAIESVQKIATELRPAILDSLGLCAAIEWQAKDFEARTGVKCHANVPDQGPPLDRDRSTALFRILQESFTNILRHADAGSVHVSLDWQPGLVTLKIHDDGRGIPAEKLSDPLSIGLIGMRERALLLGGQCHIASPPGQGTLVEVCFPLQPDPARK